jgi:RNA polymerase sigma factor (sigma-70 family)
MDGKEKSRLFEFFASEGKNLRRYVLGRIRSISEADAEDIIGDVMLRLFTRPDSAGSLENLGAYVYRAVANKAIDLNRRQARTVSLESCLDEDGELRLMTLLSDSTPGPESQAERSELLRLLGQAIDRLEPKQRAVLIATEFDGVSFRDLSERWHEPVGTLLSRKSRAVKALREMLRDFASEEL